jgi:plastocyanin
MKISIAALFLLSVGLAGCKNSQPATSASPASTPAQAAAVVVDPTTAATITGTVTYKGPALPKAHMLDMTQDPGCPTSPQPSEAIVLNNGKLSNVFIYIKEGLPAGTFPVPSEPAVLDQKGCRYIPHVMGIMAGQQLKILNTDSAQHNVHSMPTSNSPWNESQMPMGEPIVKTFSRPEMMVPLQCNQHPWMRAYVNVLTHPYFAVSGEDGKFEIRNLPPGRYTLAAVQEKFGEQTMTITVAPKETSKADFVFSQGKAISN